MTKDNEVAIDVQGMSKKFARSLKKAMIYGLADVSKAALIPHRFRSAGLNARIHDGTREAERPAVADQDAAPSANLEAGSGLRPSEFWALRNVSFQLKRGECVGVVGHNGAGKSTLFSILSGIYGPTEGRVTVNGRLQALIALGAGFHPLLTGRENIYINGTILGLKVRTISDLLDQIIDFAELQDFIDAPVRSYSSGMKVRLGYSIVAHLDPEILLVDEVLAVGDSKFQAKCQDHMRKVRDSGTALMLVSHYMQNIQGMCDRAIWLNHGQLVQQGDVMEVTAAYQRHLFTSGVINEIKGKESSGGFAAIMNSVEVLRPDATPAESIRSGEGVVVRVVLESTAPFPHGRYYVNLRPEGSTATVASFSMLLDGTSRPIREGRNEVKVTVDTLPLMPGRYQFYACVRNEDGVTALSNGCLSQPFEVTGSMRREDASLPAVVQASAGPVVLDYRWHTEGN